MAALTQMAPHAVQANAIQRFKFHKRNFGFQIRKRTRVLVSVIRRRDEDVRSPLLAALTAEMERVG